MERLSTTRARLVTYLNGKIRMRGWKDEPVDPVAIADRFAELGYIDDRGWGEAKAVSMARRGLGARRVAGTLRQAGIQGEDAAAIAPGVEQRALDAALAFARRRRIGPFAETAADRPLRQKHIAAMLRGGHSLDLARAIAMMQPGEDPAERTE